MHPKLADRVATLRPSATVEMTERVRAARASGRRIIGLSSGDPGLPTDGRIVDAAVRAMRDGDTHYGPAAGSPALREALAERERLRSGAAYGPGDILVTPGGKFALLTALMGVVEPGDEVLVPEPGWVSYGPCVRLCGGVPVALPMLDRVDPEVLAEAVTPRTVAIILNSPVNPTARVLSGAEVDAVVALAERHDLWIVWDQVYSDLLHVGTFAAPQGRPEGQARTLVVDSMSKTFGMTGWRLGSLAMPSGVVRAVQRFMQHSAYCVPGFIQQAGVQALALFDELVPQYRALFRARQALAAERLATLPGFRCALPDAGFYLFPSVEGDDTALAAAWLERLAIASLPGSAFGAAGAGHIRLSLTAADTELVEALDLIERFALTEKVEA
jgi:aspartate/methionine/tyrosine aminotransferase